MLWGFIELCWDPFMPARKSFIFLIFYFKVHQIDAFNFKDTQIFLLGGGHEPDLPRESEVQWTQCLLNVVVWFTHWVTVTAFMVVQPYICVCRVSEHVNHKTNPSKCMRHQIDYYRQRVIMTTFFLYFSCRLLSNWHCFIYLFNFKKYRTVFPHQGPLQGVVHVRTLSVQWQL